MSEDVSNANPNPSEGEVKQQEVDMSKFVPKEEYDKLANTKGSELSSLQRSLEEAQASLTSPEYLAYLTSKKEGDETTKQESGAESKRIANLEAALSQVAAMLELQQVEGKYKDFNDYRSDVQTIISKNGNLTFEQAYLIAKQQRPPEPAKEETTKEAPKGTEKPGYFVPDENTEKNFKTVDDANADTIRQIKEKYNIVGDTI